MIYLRLAYALNLLILVPVCASLWSTPPGEPPAAMQGKFADSHGLRMLVFSLWMAILLLSMLGLFYPLELAGLLLFQILYKSLYCLAFARPLYRRKGPAALPSGLIGSFVMIIVTYPILLLLGLRTHSG